jgi:hypothetical protein
MIFKVSKVRLLNPKTLAGLRSRSDWSGCWRHYSFRFKWRPNRGQIPAGVLANATRR